MGVAVEESNFSMVSLNEEAVNYCKPHSIYFT